MPGHSVAHERKIKNMPRKKEIAKYLHKEGTFRVQVARCYVKESTRMARTFHVTEFRIVGQKTLYAVLDRCAPETEPLFRRGQRLHLVTRLIELKRRANFPFPKTFTDYRWLP